jgi:DNA-binding IclR family transcriptional regulator
MLALQPELEPSPVAGLRAELVRLHDALHPRQPAPTAALAARAGLAETTVSAGLGELELLGLAVRAGDGRWRRG